MGRIPPVLVVTHGRPGAGRASVAPLAGLSAPAVDEPEVAQPEAFDPSAHNIDDVKAHIESGGDVAAVLEAERARGDDARSTLIEWLETHEG